MRIAILGGRFDPPHLGHYWIAKQVLDYGPEIDRVLLVPAHQHQWKPIIASGKDRLNMLSSFVEKNIEVSDGELQRKGISYTVQTVKEVKEQTNAEIYWIVGADILPELPRWERTGELINLATFLVFPRDPYTLPPELPPGFSIVMHKDLVTTNLSSTLIRDRIQQGKSIRGFVHGEIKKYIEEKGLYK